MGPDYYAPVIPGQQWYVLYIYPEVAVSAVAPFSDTESDPNCAPSPPPPAELPSCLLAAAKNRQDRGKAGYPPPGLREGPQPQEPRVEVVG